MVELENKNLEEQGVETPEQENSNQQYIDMIKDLKANTVSKDRYNRLMEENKNLLESLVNGEVVAAAAPEEKKKTASEIASEMRKLKGPMDAAFIEKALEFRQAVLEETGEDCFVSKGHNATPKHEDYVNAQLNADFFKQCLDNANGDNQAFINEFQRCTVDNPLINKNNNRR